MILWNHFIYKCFMVGCDEKLYKRDTINIYTGLTFFLCFQYNIFKERKRNNIQPNMPSLKERIQIKKEHMSSN